MGQEIIDSQGNLVDYESETALEVLQTLLPYFPDDERMANYLCYISSGFTRAQALTRSGATSLDRDSWRSNSEFCKLDDAGYTELRRNVADAYAERLVRRNTIQWLEFDHELLKTAQAKYEDGIELTKDEKAILLKRASTYSPETLTSINKLMNKEDSNAESLVGEGAFDMVAFVMRRRSLH